MDYSCFFCCILEREREIRVRRWERTWVSRSEVHALIHHQTLISLCVSYPDPPTSTTHFFLWLPCAKDINNHKRLIMCFRYSLWSLTCFTLEKFLFLLVVSFYFYFPIGPHYLRANTSDVTSDAQCYFGKININKRN